MVNTSPTSYTLFSTSTKLCAICAHKLRSLELGTSCPPPHEYILRCPSSTSPLVKATKNPHRSLSPRTKLVGIWTNDFPARETSSLLRPLRSNGGKGETRTRHLTLCGWWRSDERTAAPPSECAKMTSGWLVWIEEAMYSVAAMTVDGESPSHHA